LIIAKKNPGPLESLLIFMTESTKNLSTAKKSKKSFTEEEDIDEDDLIPSNYKDDQVDSMLDKYYKEEKENKEEFGQMDEGLEDEMLSKFQGDIFKTADDVFYDLFSKVLEFDPEQIIRYCRDDVIPLWFNSKEMLTMKNTKCKQCKGDLIYEFQVMPNIFNIFKEIFNIDIGVIVIYSCKDSCNNKENYVEELAFIQRTGEKIIDFDNLYKGKQNNNNITQTQNQTKKENENIKELSDNLSNVKIAKNENEDEDGWVEVKKKKNKK